jgi:hypothetical protein
MARAANVQVTDPNGKLGALAYDLRNEAVVRGADRLIVVWSAIRHGGTFFTACAASMREVATHYEVLAGSDTFDVRSRGV